MSIRTRAILVIIFTNLLIILFSVSAGISYVRKGIQKSQETDLTVVADIADHFISSEIEALKLKASGVVQNFTNYPEKEWPEILANQITLYPEFIGMAVFDNDNGLVAASGEFPATPDILNDKYIKQVFMGKKIFSSTFQTSDGVVFYLAAPLPYPPSHNRALIVTLPGMYFSERLSTFVIWESGHIFIDDDEGTVIANIREQWVQGRFNFIKMAEADKQYEGMASVIKRMVKGESGIGYFSVSDVPRICAYRPVAGSEEGWCLGVVGPLPESPARNIDQGLLVVAIVSVFLNVIAAIVASNFVKKPYQEVAALKETAELNSQYKSKFLAAMSHEIRTPMNVILGVTDSQLSIESLSPTTKEAFEKIFDSGHLLLNIINDILDLSKIESGKFELYPVKYEVLSLINDSANMSIIQYGHKRINFILNVDENIPLHLFGDELRIKQILNNLLSNAFKYTDAGEVELSFKAESLEENKTIIFVIQVRDTGQGMTNEQQARLFKEYERFNLEANRNIMGTGLGMAITKNMVKMMNGEIFVDSTPGKGSTFTIRMPQEIKGSDVLGREAAENLKNFNFINTKLERHTKIIRVPMPYGKVLIVDDMKSNLDVARLLLNPYQLQIDTAESGFEAIDIIKSGNVYDIVFMDHMMPQMDGMETTKKLREGGYTNPIIALTANAIAGQQEIFYANGFDGFISKPIDLRQLNDSLNKFIRDKERDRMKEASLPAASAVSDDLTKKEVQSFPVIKIPGVDTETGLALYGGDQNIYIAVLRSFLSNVKNVMEKLRYVSEETLGDYTVNVHGLKGICAGIGAEKTRQAAFNLEKAARSGDLAGVLVENEVFLKETEELTSAVQAWFDAQDKKNTKPILPCPDRNLLSRLYKCCKDYDMNGADEIMDELESADYETDASLVTWLRERIDESDFSSAARRLSEYGVN